jgi:hypothetical protein
MQLSAFDPEQSGAASIQLFTSSASRFTIPANQLYFCELSPHYLFIAALSLPWKVVFYSHCYWRHYQLCPKVFFSQKISSYASLELIRRMKIEMFLSEWKSCWLLELSLSIIKVILSCLYQQTLLRSPPCCWTGLPDGIFSNQKSKFEYILEGLAIEKVAIFYGHLVSFTAIWYILWVIWYILFCFGVLYKEKSGNPAHGSLQ